MSYLKKIGKNIGGKSAGDRLAGAAQGAVVGFKAGGPMGAAAGAIAGGAAGKSGIEHEKERLGFNKAIDSLTGKTARRHQAQKEEAQKQKVRDAQGNLKQFAEGLKAKPELRDIQSASIGTPQEMRRTNLNLAPTTYASTDFGNALIRGQQNIPKTLLAPAATVGTLGSFDEATINESDMGGYEAETIGDIGTFGAATLETDPQAQVRAGQAGLISDLQAQSRGEGPSLAESESRRAFEEAIASQYAMAAGKGPMALRQAQRNVAALQQQAAAESADIRMREQLAARQQLGAALSGTRGQDIGLATTAAELEQQAGLAQAEADTQRAFRQAELGQQMGLASSEAETQRAFREAAMAQEMGLAESQAETDRAMQEASFRQQRDLTQGEMDQTRLLRERELDQQRDIAQAELTQSADIRRAELETDANLANARNKLERDIAQGRISAGEAQAEYQAEVDRMTRQAELDQQADMLVQELASREGIAATQAQLEATRAVLQSETDLASGLAAARARKEQSQNQLFGAGLGAAATVAAAFV